MATDLTVAEFREQFPEFGNNPEDAVVESRLALARTICGEDVWGEDRSFGLAWLTAHYCAMDPGATHMRININKSNPTTYYEVQFKTLLKAVAGGARISSSTAEYRDLVNLINR